MEVPLTKVMFEDTATSFYLTDQPNAIQSQFSRNLHGLTWPSTDQQCRPETEKHILEDLFSSTLSQLKKYHRSRNLNFNNLGIFQSLKLRTSGKKQQKILQFPLSNKFNSKYFGLLWINLSPSSKKNKKKFLGILVGLIPNMTLSISSTVSLPVRQGALCLAFITLRSASSRNAEQKLYY